MIPYRIIGGALAVVMVGSGGVYLGYQWASGDAAQERARAVRRAIEQDQERQAQNKEVVDAWASQAREKNIVYRTIRKEVVKYVDKHPDRECLEPDAVRLLNAAARGDRAELPTGAGTDVPREPTDPGDGEKPRDPIHGD